MGIYLVASQGAPLVPGRLLNLVQANLWPLLFFVLMLACYTVSLLGATLPVDGELQHTDFLPIYPLLVVPAGVLLGAMPGATRAMRPAGIAALLLTGGGIAYDVFFPGALSRLDTRAAGFAGNANVAALDLLLLLAMTLRYRKPTLLDPVLLSGSLLVVIFTFSRGGLVLWAVLALVYLGYQIRQLGVAKSLVPVATLALGAALLLHFIDAIVGGTPIMASETTQGRLNQVLVRDSFHDPVDDRIILFETYLALAFERPFLGYGGGFSVSDTGGIGQGPHNMYLRAWIDQGLPGLLAYLGLLGSGLVATWRRGLAQGVAFVAVVAVAGVFSHNIIDDKAFLLLFGIALGLSADPAFRRAAAQGRG